MRRDRVSLIKKYFSLSLSGVIRASRKFHGIRGNVRDTSRAIWTRRGSGGSNLDENVRVDALDSFILFYRREKRCLRTKIRGITFSFGTRVQEVAKMSDAVDTVSDEDGYFLSHVKR